MIKQQEKWVKTINNLIFGDNTNMSDFYTHVYSKQNMYLKMFLVHEN